MTESLLTRPLDADQLKTVRDCGRNMVPIEEVAHIIHISTFILMQEMQVEESVVRKAYYDGFTETSVNIRRINREIAEAGSPAAINALMQNITQIENQLFG